MLKMCRSFQKCNNDNFKQNQKYSKMIENVQKVRNCLKTFENDQNTHWTHSFLKEILIVPKNAQKYESVLKKL